MVTSLVPNELITWATVPGSPIQHAGRVRFQPNTAGGTRMDVQLSYNPVAGGLGHGVAALFGVDPMSEMDQDLMRMKTMIEESVEPRDAGTRGAEGQSYIR